MIHSLPFLRCKSTINCDYENCTSWIFSEQPDLQKMPTQPQNTTTSNLRPGRVKDLPEPRRSVVMKQLNAESARRYRERQKRKITSMEEEFKQNEKKIASLEKMVTTLSDEIKRPSPSKSVQGLRSKRLKRRKGTFTSTETRSKK